MSFAFRRLLGNLAWSTAAKRFSLKRGWRASPGPGRLTGEVNGLTVEVVTQRLEVHGERVLHTRIRVDGLPRDVSLAARVSGTSRFTGVSAFDEEVVVEGPRPLLLSALSTEIRDHVLMLISRGALRLSRGSLYLLVPHTVVSARRVSDDVFRCLRVAEALTDLTPTARRLQRAVLDASPLEYRRKVWQALITEEGLELAWFATHLEHADVHGQSLLNALLSGDSSRALAALAALTAEPLPLRMMALDALEARDEVSDELVDAALAGPVSLVRRVISCFAARGLAVPVSGVERGLLDAPAEVAVVLVRWIGTSDEPSVARAAVHALAHEDRVKIVACDVLVFAGGRAALAPLIDVRGSSNADVRKAAARAIEAIQGRVGGDVGSVAVVDERIGAVEVVD